MDTNALVIKNISAPTTKHRSGERDGQNLQNFASSIIRRLCVSHVTIHGHHSSEKIVEVIFASRDVNIFANLKRAGEALDILIKSRQLRGAILKDNPLKIDLARAPQSIPTRNVMLATPMLQAAVRNGTVSGTS